MIGVLLDAYVPKDLSVPGGRRGARASFAAELKFRERPVGIFDNELPILHFFVETVQGVPEPLVTPCFLIERQDVAVVEQVVSEKRELRLHEQCADAEAARKRRAWRTKVGALSE